MYKPGIDVVVVNYRTPDDLRGFVRSFAEVQYEVPATLHVVNVDPTPEDMDVAEEELEAIEVPTSFSYEPSNIGYAKACNYVAKAVGEDARQTIALFNADTRLRAGVLDDCHWKLHQNPDWGVIGPKQIDDDNKITHAGIFGTNEQPSFMGRWKAYNRPDRYGEVDSNALSVSGSAYFVKRACWDALTNCPDYRAVAPDAEGAFLPTQHYYEEFWCSLHAREHGWKVVYNGQSTMVHRWHKASKVGGYADQVMPKSLAFFREACDAHGIAHE